MYFGSIFQKKDQIQNSSSCKNLIIHQKFCKEGWLIDKFLLIQWNIYRCIDCICQKLRIFDSKDQLVQWHWQVHNFQIKDHNLNNKKNSFHYFDQKSYKEDWRHYKYWINLNMSPLSIVCKFVHSIWHINYWLMVKWLIWCRCWLNYLKYNHHSKSCRYCLLLIYNLDQRQRIYYWCWSSYQLHKWDKYFLAI